jgi:hypothetical protein
VTIDSADPRTASTETTPTFFDPGQGELKAMVTSPQRVGFYTLLADTTRIAQTAVNVDTGESNLNARRLDDGGAGTARVVDVTGDLAEDIRRERQGREVFAAFLLLALSALVAEALLGRKA